MLGLVAVGLGAGIVYGFFALIDARDRADILEQREQFYSLYVPFQNEGFSGFIYLNPPNFNRGYMLLDLSEPVRRNRQLVVWVEHGNGRIKLVRPLFPLQQGDTQLRAPLFQLPDNITRLFITEERAPFAGQEPVGEEVVSADVPLAP
jgi:hypothetical protein